jgi:hypothetical protein
MSHKKKDVRGHEQRRALIAKDFGPEAFASVVAQIGARSVAADDIADAFAAILSAEQNSLGVRVEWPALQPPAPIAPPEPIITDEVIDRVARRVIEQLSDRVVRETVASIASDTAERLVREEIERIKASIR